MDVAEDPSNLSPLVVVLDGDVAPADLAGRGAAPGHSVLQEDEEHPQGQLLGVDHLQGKQVFFHPLPTQPHIVQVQKLNVFTS